MSAGWLAIPVAVCAWSALYQWLGAVLVGRWLKETPAIAETLPPVTLLRPLKPDVPDLRGKLEALARAMRPGDQLVLGAAVGSEEWQECETLQRTFPDREIIAVACREDAAVNPKISKLVQMESECRHGRLILSDSEALIDAAWLDAFRHEWEEHAADALTTGYRFAGAATWPQRLDAVPTLVSLWPGLALVRRWGRVNFTLGACTGLRQRDLTEIGGWRALGDFLAEDRELGAALVAHGRTVRLAAAVTTLDSDPLTWREWWRHQRRVAATYRACAPAGFAGMLLTHGATAAVILAAVPVEKAWRPWCWGGAVGWFVIRWLAARRLATVLSFPIPGLPVAMLVGGMVETMAWMLSWLPVRIWWSARWWRIAGRGKLVAAPARTVFR
ncbi:MAG: glycosyltransferase [Chthoniobacteraceae bacterium]